MRASATRVALLVAACLAAAACSTPDPAVRAAEIAVPRPPHRVDFAVPDRLRPCCAFGANLSVSVAELPVPMLQLSNVVDPRELGEHAYNAGLVSTEHGIQQAFVSTERNGLVYTCRGGFIDLAHVRDYADWTVFLTRWIASTLDRGGRLELPDEGGRRFIYLTAIDPALRGRVGSDELALAIAQWLAFQLSIWHETATWYAWASLDLFPELASAFSPEDLYSNLLGVKLAGLAIVAGSGRREDVFNRGVDDALASLLERLAPAPPETTRRALGAVDGRWWDSSQRLPAKSLVLRRNLALGPELEPWLVPGEVRSPELAADLDRHCAERGQQPFELAVPDRVLGVPIAELAMLDIQLEPGLARRVERPDPGSDWISQDDLPSIVSSVRAQNLAEFGPEADRP